MGKKTKSFVREWVTTLLIAASIMMVVRLFLFAPYEVHGESMYPTFEGEELLIVNKWIYDVSTPDYGDIVVFHTAQQRDFIKRVIGLPGDQIAVREGQLFRNGKPVQEPYINEENQQNLHEVTVPKDHVFVMGDNRNYSRDSREIGPVHMKEVVGRADIQLKPFQNFRLLF
ncbi:signal peptidase I [Kroppenstedtia pulmonis]|nr:signal peptidase I [Kroppenstedtia pulmonis]